MLRICLLTSSFARKVANNNDELDCECMHAQGKFLTLVMTFPSVYIKWIEYRKTRGDLDH